MATWTLGDIQQLVRQITGLFGPNDISNTQLLKDINQFYQFTWPAETKFAIQQVYYEFLTTANQPTYAFDSANYQAITPPLTLNNLNTLWYQDPTYFDENNPNQYSSITPWTGDGATVAFSTTVTGFPIYPGTVIIYDGVESFKDTNTTYSTTTQTITGSAGGSATVNYSTGVVSVSFAIAPLNGQEITLSYVVFAAGRPNAVLFYDNTFTFFPVPDNAYNAKIKAYRTYPAFVNSTDTPLYPQWGPAIAYGTAKVILARLKDEEAYQMANQKYQEQLDYALDRTENYLLTTRAKPFF